jgi:hypothetical protein
MPRKSVTRKPRTVLVWSGLSSFDARVRIGAFLTFRSNNPKTGDIPQLMILRLDMSPVQAVRRGLDDANCKHRGIAVRKSGRTRFVNRSCYVAVIHGPRAIYASWKRGNVPTWSVEQAAAVIAGQTLRLGSYGDPAAVPVAVLETLAAAAARTVGYSHQWKTAGLQGLVMASCDTVAERLQAKDLGYRTFRVSTDIDPQAREILCPASEQAGKRTQCERCGLCDGSRLADRRADIMIPVHGSAGRKFFPMTVSQ